MEAAALAAVSGRSGLELGGPSRIFEPGKLLPVYNVATRIDNVNFAVRTTWEPNLRDGAEFRFHPDRPPGTQWIRDAVALNGISDHAYDFVISSHCLEHVANPLRALHEWRRVTRAGGNLLLILPDPAHTFDHRRPTTTIAHLRDDLRRNVGEDDLTHLAEILALHDLARDPWAGTPESFRARSQDNRENRCLHHHVFDLPLVAAALEETGWEVLAIEAARPVHLVALARNTVQA
jgi:SAM-dependent methyltransferase